MMRQQRWMGWVAMVFMVAGMGWGQIPTNPMPTNFSSVQIVPHDAGCVWQVTPSYGTSEHFDGPRSRRTLFGMRGAEESAHTKVGAGLIQGEAWAYDATLTDAAQAGSGTAGTSTFIIQRIQACAAPQPVISINYSTSFLVRAKVEGSTSRAMAAGTVTARVPELKFQNVAKEQVESSSVAVPAGVVPVHGIPVPVYSSSAPITQTRLATNAGGASRPNITTATLTLNSDLQVGTFADAMIGIFKTTAEAFVGAHIMAFEFTGRCSNCGGRVDVIRT